MVWPGVAEDVRWRGWRYRERERAWEVWRFGDGGEGGRGGVIWVLGGGGVHCGYKGCLVGDAGWG